MELIEIESKSCTQEDMWTASPSTLSVAQGLADSPTFSNSKNPRNFSQIININ